MNRKRFSTTSLIASALLLSTSILSVATAANDVTAIGGADAASAVDGAMAADGSADGQLFPDLMKVDGSGEQAVPDIGNGKWTLVMVWATTCHICEIDKPLMSKLHEKHKGGEIEVFGISVDGAGRMPEIQSYLGKRDISFPNSVGEFITVNSSMINIAEESLRGTPTYLLFSPEGDIKAVQAGHLAPETVENFIESNS